MSSQPIPNPTPYVVGTPTPIGFARLFGSDRQVSKFPGAPIRMPPQPPSNDIDDLRFAATGIDNAGRIGDRSAVRALAWDPGRRVTMLATAGLLVASTQPDGHTKIGVTGYLTIPASLRRIAHIRPGDRLLIAVTPPRGLMVIYTAAALGQALYADRPEIWRPTS